MYLLLFLMNRKRYKQFRIGVVFFVGIIVFLAVNRDSYLLAIAGVLTGVLFMLLARLRTKVMTDERELSIGEKAARMTYVIFTPTIGIASFLLLFPSKSGLSVFSKGEWAYMESLGILFAYLSIFLIMIYAISFHFFNKKYGGGDEE